MRWRFFWTGSAHAEDFTGPRIEARAGWDRASPGDKQSSVDGISYGIAAGYDIALTDSLIAGLEAGVDLFNNDTSWVSGTTAFESSAKRDIEFAGRIGTGLGENFLVYAKAGYSNARFEETMTVGGTTGNSRTELSTNLDGIRVGAGLETKLDDGIYAKTEYRYTNYEQGVSRHQVVAAIGLRF
ncbi:outer membrane protein [Erythrobacter mangrovi]|uniref:outer membrane protein n=1 Tax=Erythrobacter mangrovi TaxID=2739433 RepID=UPI002278855D|nr:outer membrane beta-barrel protein [Erythrobacter mangrovi]